MNRFCTYIMHNKKECGERLLEGDNKCLYHSENLEAKKEKFNEKFLNKLKADLNDKEKEILDFKGYIFPDSIILEKIDFTKDTYFTDCHFHGEQTVFRWVKFSAGNTEFADAHFFAKTTQFENSHFLSDITDFSSTTFKGQKASFSRTHFGNEKGEVDFRGANFFVETLDLSHARLTAKSMEFERVTFLKKGKESKVNTSVNLHSAYIDNVSELFESLRIPKKGPKSLRKKEHYFNDFRFHLGATTAAQHAVIDRKTRDAWYLDDYKKQHSFIHWFWDKTAKCGEGIWRWGLLSLGITFIFALIFYFCFYRIDQTAFEIQHLNRSSPFLTFWYFSIATFTTLGSGDIVPMNDWLQVVVMVEVFIGYIMLGGLISIFANKLARRS